MGSGLNPVAVVVAVGALLAMGAFLGALVIRHRAVRWLMFTLGLVLATGSAGFVVMVYYPQAVDARYRAYRGFYGDIATGMTREQVMAALGKRYPDGGPRKRPKILEDSPTRLAFFMDPESSREPNCEGIFLALADGRVTHRSYSRD